MQAVSVIIVILQEIKVIYEDNQFNNAQCKALLHHCGDLTQPINQLQDNADLVNSNSAALTSMLNLLVDCRKFCGKFHGSNFLRTLSHHNRDKDKFITLHRKIDSAVASLNLQLATNIHLNVAQAQKSAKEEHDRTQAMLMRLLAATGRQEEFLRLPPKDRKGFLERARQMSENLTDLGNFDIDELDEDANSATHNHSGSRQTKLSVFNSLIEDIDFALLKHWNVATAEATNPKRLIGQGTFGKVYRVEYEGREVALKHFPCLTSTNLENRPSDREIRAIKKEACTLQYCSKHENVIGFLGVSMEKGIILMEMAVCSLFCIIYGTPEVFGTLPAGVNVSELKSFHYKSSVVLDIASALHFLHFHNIMHRDIKSCNVVMVASAPRAVSLSASTDTLGSPRASTILVPKLSDFGLATAVGSATKTTPGLSAVGSTAYMSPEILDYSGKLPPYTPAVDIFALGVLANEIFTETIPWQGHREAGIISKVVFQSQRSEPLFRPTEAPTSLAYRVAHEVIGDATKGCLHQDPLQRPTAKDLSYDWELLRLAAMPPSADSRSHSPVPGMGSQSTETLGTPRPYSYSASGATASGRGLAGGAANAAKLSAAIESTLAEQYDIAAERADYFEQLTSAFATELVNFELFAFDAKDLIEEQMLRPNAEDVLVTQVLKPLHEVTQKYITDKMKDSVYHHAPELLLSEIEALDAAYIQRLMGSMGTDVTDLHTAMLNADSGFITPADQSLRLPQLVRIMLRMHALGVVSQPRCCLLPAPGARVLHKKEHFHEVMNEGSSRVFGMLQEDDLVQVVRSGLYIEGATPADTLRAKPVKPGCVRRLNVARAASSKYSVAHGGIKSDFEATFVNFENFALEAENVLEEMNYHNAGELLVNTIMVPIFQITLRYVTERRKDPKYNSEPRLLLLDLADLDEAAISGLMDKMGVKVPQLATAMVNAAARGTIGDTMPISQLVRHFLRLHASVMLSTTPCWLTPIPGERRPYQFTHCTEILSPGGRSHGKIQEGAEVEVVLCGLTFNTSAEPVIKCLVRRILPNLIANNFTNNIPVSPADVKAEFDVDYADFDLFCCECMDCLECMTGEQVTDFLCPNILSPISVVAKAYIAERVAKGQLRLQELAGLDDAAIEALLATAGSVVVHLHERMLAASAEGSIEPDGMRLPGLLRSLLRTYALAALSQPVVYLHPTPGDFTTHREGFCVEICSPGAKIYGRIKEGARVEVMLFGLYYEDPLLDEKVRPAVPAQVRRQISADTSVNN